jgi:hypothetical protein
MKENNATLMISEVTIFWHHIGLNECYLNTNISQIIYLLVPKYTKKILPSPSPRSLFPETQNSFHPKTLIFLFNLPTLIAAYFIILVTFLSFPAVKMTP